MSTYTEFLDRKSQLGGAYGFDPLWLPESLFPFQKALVDWALRKGRGAIFADCGLGKTIQQLVWAENVVRKTNKNVLIITPLAVSYQTIMEGEKFGVECHRSKEGKITSKIMVTNYENLGKFNPNDFIGVVADESGILKHFTGATQKAVTRFMLKMPYRLLCTATPSPNDFVELGTSSEALGYLGYSDMITRFFVMDDKKRHRMNDVKLARDANKPGAHFAKLAYRVSQTIGQFRLKGHSQDPFWQWVCSWARACRKPSDLGFDDGGFALPPLTENEHIIKPTTPANGMLFQMPAFGLREEREERSRTLDQRCEYVANLVDHDKPAVIWCHFNAEGDLLEKIIPGCVQVSGSDSDDRKEEAFLAFTKGEKRVIITKPRCAAWGMNWQHCAHVVTFASHSFEQYYQSIRRCWRFGQKSTVSVDIIATEGEKHVIDNMSRKAKAADHMFQCLIDFMYQGKTVDRKAHDTHIEIPEWL